MKPFNLEEAKAGKPVCTRNGHDVRILTFDVLSDHPIIAIVKVDEITEVPITCTSSGFVFSSDDHNLYDLMMKTEGWVNLYRTRSEEPIEVTGYIYPNKEVALENKIDSDTYIGTFLVDV